MKQTLLLLLVAWLPITASAYYAKIGKIYYDFNYSEKTATVTYKEKGDDVGTFVNDCSGDVNIPSEVTFNNYTYSVTNIGHGAFYGCKGITSVTIPNSVKIIESYAFYGSGLKSVDIPSNVSSIGYVAFNNCSELSTLIIEEGVKSIGEGAFHSCVSLTSVTIPNSVTNIEINAFSGCSGLISIRVENGNMVYDSRDNCNAIIKTSENKMIRGCINTTIPSSVTTIDGAFSDCSELTSINIPNSVTTIDGAFSGCSGLTSINIPNSVTTIGDYAFKGCSGLTSITIPSSVTSIGKSAFYDCNNLTSVNLPESLVYVANDTFESTPWYDSWYTSQPDGLVYLGKIAFKYKGTIAENTELVIRDGTLGISDNAFMMCRGLTSVTIPSSVKRIGRDAFYYLQELKSVYISDLTAWCKISFDGYDSNPLTYANFLILNGERINDLEIPTSITHIGNYTFSGILLNSLKMHDKITSIGDGAFYRSVLSSVDIPNSVTSIGIDAFSYSYGIKHLTIGNQVNSIGSGAFRSLTALKEVSIPNSVTSIGKEAFQYCSILEQIKIPSNVTSIGPSAFSNCNDLTRVIVEIEEPLPLTYKSDFSNSANATLYVPGGSAQAYANADIWKLFKEIKEYSKKQTVACSVKENYTVTVTASNDPTKQETVIPEVAVIDDEAYPVTAIGENAFKDNTELALVCIPETIEEIGNNAFAGCSGLTAIYSYAEEPIALGSAKAMVRTRAAGDETSASAVFANVDKEKCILYVPKNSSDKYRNVAGWNEFQNIAEMQSVILGDANNDAEVDGKDIKATVDYILEGKTQDFIFKNADVKVDSSINAADIVNILNIIKN